MTSLIRRSLPAPGRLGFNADQSSVVENHEFGLTATNMLVNDAERIEARPGWVNVTTTGNHSDDTGTLHEYIVNGTTVEIISVAANGVNTKFYKGTDTLTDITGTATIGGTMTDDVALLNYNGKVVGLHVSGAFVYTSGGSFADIAVASGTAPTSNIACVSHGRIWGVDSDLQTIKWCALLDETHWLTGGGSLDLANVWPDGLDQVVALVPFQNKLIVFGKRSIIMYAGLEDPATNMTTTSGIDDAIKIGAVSKDAIVSIGTELFFMSRTGLRALGRAIEYERLPLETKVNQADQLLTNQIDTAIEAGDSIIMAYHQPLNGIVCRIGANYWFFDVRREDIVRMFVWDGASYSYTSALSSEGSLYYGVNGGLGEVSGFNDDDTASYVMEWISPWIPMEVNGRLFVPKRAVVFAEADFDYEVTLRWGWDYEASYNTEVRTISISTSSEYNAEGSQRGGVDEYGAEGSQGFAEYGPRKQVTINRYRLTGFGSLMQIGFSVTVDGSQISLQQIDIFGKLGRLFR